MTRIRSRYQAMPAPDDLILTQMPIEYYKVGTMNSDEVILGGNSFDGLVPFELPPGQLNASDFAAATAQWPAEMKEIYPLSRFGGNTNAPLAMSDGDCCVVCAGYELARLMTNAGARVHTFYYDYGPVCGDEAITKQLTTPSSGWASHASEIPWVFVSQSAALPFVFWFERICCTGHGRHLLPQCI